MRHLRRVRGNQCLCWVQAYWLVWGEQVYWLGTGVGEGVLTPPATMLAMFEYGRVSTFIVGD